MYNRAREVESGFFTRNYRVGGVAAECCDIPEPRCWYLERAVTRIGTQVSEPNHSLGVLPASISGGFLFLSLPFLTNAHLALTVSVRQCSMHLMEITRSLLIVVLPHFSDEETEAGETVPVKQGGEGVLISLWQVEKQHGDDLTCLRPHCMTVWHSRV